MTVGLWLNWSARLWGKLFGDRGYISQELFEQLWAHGLQLITKLKRNMKNRLRPVIDKLLLRKRALIECVNDQLKISVKSSTLGPAVPPMELSISWRPSWLIPFSRKNQPWLYLPPPKTRPNSCS
jgi:Transposase DDE domain